MKFRDMVKELELIGYTLARVTGSHYIFRHPRSIKAIVLLHNSKNREFGPSFVRRTLNQARQWVAI